jgi:hypothetical protein
MNRLCAALLVVGLASGCARAVPGTPEEAVKKFFATVAARDCAALATQIGGKLDERVRAAGCEAALHDLGGMQLERVEGAALDGRSRGAWLVRVRLRGKPEATLVRVEERGGRWVVVAL